MRIAWVLGLALLLPSVALASDEVFSISGTGPGWVAMKFHAPAGSDIVYHFRAESGPGHMQQGDDFSFGDGYSSVSTFGPFEPDGGVHLVAADKRYDADVRPGGSWMEGIGSAWVDQDADVRVAFWFGGNITSWKVSVVHDGPTSATNGTRTFLYTARDFDAPTKATVGLYGVGGARAMVDAERRVDIANSLVGVYYNGGFGTGGGSRDALTADTPSGTQLCPCAFDSAPPGSYVFKDSGVGAGLFGTSILYAGGADLVWP